MRVCHVIHNLQPGGAEDLLVDLAVVAPTAGIELSVLSLLPVAGQRHAERLLALGVPVASLDLRSRWTPRALPAGVAAVAATGPAVVHTHLKHADLVGGYAARRLGVPHVSTLHLIESQVGPIGRAKRLLAAQARARGAARTLAVSHAQRSWYLDTFRRVEPCRVVTVHNGVLAPAQVDESRLAEVRAALGAQPDRLLVSMVGIMRPGKGHDQLLDGLALLGPELPVTVVLAGDGPLRAALEQRVASAAGLLPPVVFAGFRDDVPVLLAASDLVVHPSLAEALPTSLIHALAAGRPVVATRVGGTPEVVAEGTGALVPPNHPSALAEALRWLLTDDSARLAAGAAGRRHYQATFEASGWADRLHHVYAQVLAEAALDRSGRRA